jgi:hypothetical protein
MDMLILENPHKRNIYNPLQAKLYENLNTNTTDTA